ncbi:MAG: ADP-ribosylglycohydrolase family protein [Planctomycetia bacterium]|nr:ADP-ribosylglycohydrolase family protein [Planctomycetia bacterium]
MQDFIQESFFKGTNDRSHTPNLGRSRTFRSGCRVLLLLVLSFCVATGVRSARAEGADAKEEAQFRRLSVEDYRDKTMAGWIGQIAGVCWGAPTEFKFVDRIIPEENVPVWSPELMNNAFGQDDLYVEMTFLRTMELYGLDCSIRQAGIDFANSQYPLWCANREGRKNLRSGIAPPDSGHPRFNRCPNDIDYQIEADFSGLISPGLPNQVIALGEKFGRLMNYGDGIYGGVFMGALYAEAFFSDDLNAILDAGLAAIPPESQYAEMVRDVRAWHAENPDDWTFAWNRCLEKYRKNPEYQKASNGAIDVKINGACILLGLLYGNGDLDQTILISMRAGYDSDCNPSSAAGALFTTLGAKKLPSRFVDKLRRDVKFSHTEYDFDTLVDVCEKLARQTVAAAGGRMETIDGVEYFLIPIQQATPKSVELSWDPKPAQNALFTPDEMAQIRFDPLGTKKMQDVLDKFSPGWKISQCGSDMNPGLEPEYAGKKDVLKTHPLSRSVPCLLTRNYAVEPGKKTTLAVCVTNHAGFDWVLRIRINGSVQVEQTIAGDTWQNVTFDLTPFAGSTTLIELENLPNGWQYEAGYWSQIEIIEE